jgi:hypothetical protein
MRARVPPVLFACVVWLLASPGVPQTYTWVDKDGSLHMTDDLSEVPTAQRKSAKPSRKIQLVPGSQRAPARPAASRFGPRGSRMHHASQPNWNAPSLRATQPGASFPAAADPSREQYWRDEFRPLNQGLAKVEACRSAIPANCSRTTCYSRYRYEWDESKCVGGWAVPGACAEALKTPGRTVHISWGNRKSLENFSCDPLRSAVDEAERAWRSKLDELEARAGRDGVPQNWRYD